MQIEESTNMNSKPEIPSNPEMLRLVNEKKLGKEHSILEIDWIINNLDYIPEYQLSAWLMAVCLNGFSEQETTELTRAMAYSGNVLTLKRHLPEYDPENPDRIISNRGFVDKHSTGGVGDKVSLVLSPLLASVGFKISKFSGRALGHTGGTVDKLESIPGFQTDLDMKRFEKQIEDVGIALAGQTLEFAPADKKLYSLRDRSGTVESIPLIASSVMSKKIAGGADIILLDVKVGSGAFMKNIQEAEELGKQMKAIGDNLKLTTKVLLTNMDQPLGLAVGNRAEMIEAIETLKGNNKNDFYELVMELASTITDRKELEDAIDSGKAYVKFHEFIEAQGGDLEGFEKEYVKDAIVYGQDPQCENYGKLKTLLVKATEDGYVSQMDTYQIGLAIHELGYSAKPDGSYDIDHDAGALFYKKIGDKVEAGEVIFKLHASQAEKLEDIKAKILDAYLFSKSKTKAPKLVLKSFV